jgi:hypothetical protein
MLYSEIIAVCSEIHTKHMYSRQNVEVLTFKYVVLIDTAVQLLRHCSFASPQGHHFAVCLCGHVTLITCPLRGRKVCIVDGETRF